LNNSEVLAIHGALLPTNQTLIFGEGDHSQAQKAPPIATTPARRIWAATR
jgi:hypothetical protein